MSLPKVLIIGQPFNDVTGGGITLTNLFKGWDKEKIAVTCFPYLIDNNINIDVCNTYYQLGYKEHELVFPFNLLKHKYPSGLVKFNGQKIKNLTPSRSRLRVKIIMNYFYPFLRFIGLYHYISKIKLSNEFCSWINNYKPDIIYAQASSRDAVLFCISVIDYMKKPSIFHMMDDWPSLIGNKGFLKKYWHKKFDNEFRTLLDKATLLMSISDYMAEEYKNRYDKVFVAFHNPIDIEFWGKCQRVDYELSNSPSLLYAGRTGLGINTSLEIIAKAVQFINEEHNVPLQFKLQIAENPAWIYNYSCVERHSFVSYNELPKIFSEADLLILPYDFSMESIKYVQYSMPTKAPEYMISGTPIIIFAPEGNAIVKYAKEFDWAKVVSINNVDELSKAIMQLILNKEERQKFGHNAKKIAKERHNSIKVTNEFRTLILSL